MPILYIEIGRPKDLIKAALSLTIGMILIIKNKVFENSYSAILLLITILFSFYIFEIFSIRWNQLTENEKNKFWTIMELKKNILKFLEAINLGGSKFKSLLNIFKFDKKNENFNQKKWVRNDK